MPQLPLPPAPPPPYQPPPLQAPGPQYSRNTGTAADFLTYETHQNLLSGTVEPTRVATAVEEWVVKETGGETFYVNFDNNFTKKHFVSESKKPNAPANSVDLKIQKTLGHRANSQICLCSHKLQKHPQGGYCKTCGLPNCGSFETAYGAMRTVKNKPTHDPLAGAPTKKNTCIVLNLVPRQHFEAVVLQSILDHEKPASWHQGDPLVKNVNDEVELEWDFGQQHLGAVVVADSSLPAQQWAQKQGCKVKAKKTAAGGQGHTWKIFHMGDTI